MNEYTWKDEKTTREFFRTTDEAHARASDMLKDDLIKSVKTQKIGRNEKCPCGSGAKFKHCCMHQIPNQNAKQLRDLAERALPILRELSKVGNDEADKLMNEIESAIYKGGGK